MRTLFTAAVLGLMATTAHASPTLPREFQGEWCASSKTEIVYKPGRNCLAMDMATITATEMQSHDDNCTVAYVRPSRNGRYHVTLACVHPSDETSMITIEHHWMRVDNGLLYMQRVNDSFTKPTYE